MRHYMQGIFDYIGERGHFWNSVFIVATYSIALIIIGILIAAIIFLLIDKKFNHANDHYYFNHTINQPVRVVGKIRSWLGRIWRKALIIVCLSALTSYEVTHPSTDVCYPVKHRILKGERRVGY